MIAISQRSSVDDRTNELRDCLDTSWHTFLKQCNCIGVPIPNNYDTCVKIMDTIPFDGILLTGGNTPVKYGGDSPQRDAVDDYLIHYARKNNIPLLGVCRGMQSICLHFGGSLKRVSGHVSTTHYITGLQNRTVNSFHNWSINELGAGIEILAHSEDMEVEMVTHTKYNITGIMWHPERNNPYDVEDVFLFSKCFRCEQ